MSRNRINFELFWNAPACIILAFYVVYVFLIYAWFYPTRKVIEVPNLSKISTCSLEFVEQRSV